MLAHTLCASISHQLVTFVQKTNNSPGRPGYHTEQKRRDPKQMSTSKKVLSKDFKNLTSTPLHSQYVGGTTGQFFEF